MNYFFLAAGSCAAIITLVHIFLGGPQIAHPMRNSSDLHPVVRQVNYYCWHLVSINILLMALVFFRSAIVPASWELAVVGTLMAAAYSIWGLVLVNLASQSYSNMPQGFFFLVVAVLGIIGLLQ